MVGGGRGYGMMVEGLGSRVVVLRMGCSDSGTMKGVLGGSGKGKLVCCGGS